MAESSIEWTDYTFNPLWGCEKISPGCKNCYAMAWDKRVGGKHWGPGSDRRQFSDKHWAEPLKWNAKAAKDGRIYRVFCASMADVFEDHSDWIEPRKRIFDLIGRTPNLIWLLLTKRPENIWPLSKGLPPLPSNLMFGVTIEDQQRLIERVPHIIEVKRRYPGVEVFGSYEPLLSTLEWGGNPYFLKLFAWAICGGESGHGARPMHPDWARKLRDDCARASVAFFFKQWGEWCHGSDCRSDANIVLSNGRAGSSSEDFDEETRRLWTDFRPEMMAKVGKRKAGRLLDGIEHNGLPLYWPSNVGLLTPNVIAQSSTIHLL